MKQNEQKNQYYTLSEFANRINVSQGTLRNWDKNGTLIPHHRTFGNHRMYSEEQAIAYLTSNSSQSMKARNCVKSLYINIENNRVTKIDGVNMFSRLELIDLIVQLERHLNCE